MAETFANLLDLTKEVWTDNRLQKQFYDKNLWLDRVEKTNKYTIGRRAQVPIEKSLPGGFTSSPGGVAALNAADQLHVDRADYTIKEQWQQVELAVDALNQADSVGVRSAVDAADQTIESNLSALRRGIGRQAVSNGDALIAETGVTAGSTTVNLSPTGYGYDALRRGWLRPGQLIDIGSAADEDSRAFDRTITAINKSNPADPEIVISGAAVTTAAADFVSIANARVGAVSNEIDGLRTLVGSTTTPVGGLDPQNAGEEFWAPAKVDTTTTVVSLDLLLDLQQEVYQEVGMYPTFVTTSPEQCAALYSLFQSQVRFSSDGSTEAGSVTGFKWNGLDITVDPDIPNRELYMLTLSDFCVVTGGRLGTPTWASELAGTNRGMNWRQGFTSFVDALVYPLQVGLKRRNSHAAAVGLTG